MNSQNIPFDLRSDTVTKPTPAMLQAMSQAVVGDDLFGEDPTVNHLERLSAQIFGFEAALYTPTGTMSNQIAVMAHTRPGDFVLCADNAHILLYEGGGCETNAGVQLRTVTTQNGLMPFAETKALLEKGVSFGVYTLLELENTSNAGGGVCYAWDELEAFAELAQTHHIKIHLDGARIFNALIAKPYPKEKMHTLADSMCFSLNKGLGCPAGSMLLGSTAFIQHARLIRKRLGGSMRQTGYLAATGVFALNYHVEDLAFDHQKAQTIAAHLTQMKKVSKVWPSETNMVFFEVAGMTPKETCIQLEKQHILAFPMAENAVRFVFHRDILGSGLEAICSRLSSVLG